MDPQHLSAFTRLRGLLEVTRLVRSDEDLDHLLAAIARTTAESLGFGTVVLNLYRRAWDDFCTTTVHGSEHARETAAGRRPRLGRVGQGARRPLPAQGRVPGPARHLRLGRAGAPVIRPRPAATTAAQDAWHPEDALMVPLHHSDGPLLGIMAVDEPVSGRQPTDEELDVLVALAVARRAGDPERPGVGRVVAPPKRARAAAAGVLAADRDVRDRRDPAGGLRRHPPRARVRDGLRSTCPTPTPATSSRAPPTAGSSTTRPSTAASRWRRSRRCWCRSSRRRAAIC